MAKNSQLDAQAAAFLEADISDARNKLRTVCHQIGQLEAERRALEWKISKLTGEEPKEALAREADSGAEEHTSGFREMIRNILRESDRGLKPKQVADRIVASGYQYSGSTQLSVRVGNDLHKLAKGSTVSRRRGLYYFNRDLNGANAGRGESP